MKDIVVYSRTPRSCDEATVGGCEVIPEPGDTGRGESEREMLDKLLEEIDKGEVEAVILKKGSDVVEEIEAHGGTVVEV